MLDIIKYLKDSLQAKNLDKNGKRRKRSSKWRKVRNKHIKNNPHCSVCGLKTKVECHHKIPFSLDSSLELEPDNLVTLCENKKYGINCHLVIHGGNYRDFRPSTDTTIAYLRAYLNKYEKNKNK